MCVSPVLLRYMILKLILNLIEMGSSFLQLIVADSLGRLFLIPFPFDRFFFRPEKPSLSFVASARVQQLSSLLQFFLQLLLLM